MVILPDCSCASNDEYYLNQLPASPTLCERKNYYLRFFRATIDVTLNPILTQTAWVECFYHCILLSRIIHGRRRVSHVFAYAAGSMAYCARVSSYLSEKTIIFEEDQIINHGIIRNEKNSKKKNKEKKVSEAMTSCIDF